MFDLMNPDLIRMEEARRRRDILSTIRGSRRAPARQRLGLWLRDLGERLADEPQPDRRQDAGWATRG